MSLISASNTTLAAVVQVAETRSFITAARRLGLSPSATSKAVGRLEQALGIKLFQRTTRSVTLTPEGDRFVRQIGPLVDGINALLTETADRGQAITGQLRVSAPRSFGRRKIVPLVAGFMKAYPDVAVELALTDRLIDLADEPVDLAVRSGMLKDSSNIVAKRIFRDRLTLVAAPALLRQVGEIGSIADLDTCPAVAFRNARTGRIQPWSFVNRRDVLPDHLAVADDMESVARLCRDGVGAAQLPGYLAEEYVRTGKLVEVLPTVKGRQANIFAVYLQRRLLAPSIRVFLNYLAGKLADAESA